MDIEKLKLLQSAIFSDVDNISLFVNLRSPKDNSNLSASESEGSSSTFGEVGAFVEREVYSLLGKSQINIGSSEFELEQARLADEVMYSPWFRRLVNPTIERESWADLFPEAVQARTVGIVTRCLNKAGLDELLGKPHVVAWVIYKLITPNKENVAES